MSGYRDIGQRASRNVAEGESTPLDGSATSSFAEKSSDFAGVDALEV
jgi:hypothetical protein